MVTRTVIDAQMRELEQLRAFKRYIERSLESCINQHDRFITAAQNARTPEQEQLHATAAEAFRLFADDLARALKKAKA